MEEKVEVIEIWASYDWETKKWLTRIALIVNGYPVQLNKEYMLERKFITKDEAKQIGL